MKANNETRYSSIVTYKTIITFTGASLVMLLEPLLLLLLLLVLLVLLVFHRLLFFTFDERSQC